jgi:ArsR family transcriptional regulator
MVNLFKILSDETRLKIIQFLLQQPEYHVRAMCDMLGQSQPAVSHHLALLRMAGVIECRRDGKHNYYHLLPKRFCEIRNAIQATSSSRKAWDRLFTD